MSRADIYFAFQVLKYIFENLNKNQINETRLTRSRKEGAHA